LVFAAGAAAAAVSAAAVAGADMTGSYAGQLIVAQSQTTVDAAGALTQSGAALTGTLAFGAAEPRVEGAYLVSGKQKGNKFQLAGLNGTTGARLVWRGKVTASGLAGGLKVRGAGGKVKGRLTLAPRTSTSNGSGCDAVFAANQAFFTSQVMGQVLEPICASCHVSGGQAQATRLQVMRGDPVATARAVALVIDPTNPAASLLLQKPLAAVPHGGGQRITPGSPEEQILRQWADLVSQGQCVASSGGPGATSVFAQDCAGCHGTDGAGGSSGPDVRCTVRPLLADAARRGRGTTMPPFTLTSADLTSIASFLGGRCSGQPRDVYAANCANCHGATAGGGRNADGIGGPNIRCAEGGDFGEAVRSGADRMPAFPSLGGAQIAGLARYVQSFCGLGGGGGGGDG
jgi:ubiquinol-cytochrome c reductase cytochrome c subunit